MSRKWKKPCSLCRGRLKIACMFCGWKKKDKTNKELAESEGAKARKQFLTKVKVGMNKFRMKTTGCKSIDDAVRKELGND